MHALDVLGDPVRRRLLELLASGEQSAGSVTAVIRREFGITQPAVSQHLPLETEIARGKRERRDTTEGP